MPILIKCFGSKWKLNGLCSGGILTHDLLDLESAVLTTWPPLDHELSSKLKKCVSNLTNWRPLEREALALTTKLDHGSSVKHPCLDGLSKSMSSPDVCSEPPWACPLFGDKVRQGVGSVVSCWLLTRKLQWVGNMIKLSNKIYIMTNIRHFFVIKFVK